MKETKRQTEGQRTLEEFPDVLTVEDLMEVLHIGRSVAYRLLQAGEVGAIHIGRLWRVPKHCVREYLAGAVAQTGAVVYTEVAEDAAAYTEKEGARIA